MKTLALLLAFLAQDNEDHATLASAKAEPAKFAQGEVVKLRFEIAVDKDFHIYPARPQTATLETVFELPPEVYPAGPIENPPTKRHKDAHTEYDYIEGTAVFVVPVRIFAAPGAFAIKGRVKGQACDAKQCFDMDLPFEIAVTVLENPGPRVKALSVKVEKAEAKNGEAVKVAFELEIPEKWHIYPAVKPIFGKPTLFEFGSKAEVRGTIEEPKPKRHKDNILEYDYHEGKATITVPVALREAEKGSVTVRGAIAYQICDPNQCVDNATPFSFTLKSLGGADVPAQAGGAQKDASKEAAKREGEKGLVYLLLLAIGGGLVSLIQPCVFPLLPITITYFVKQGEGSRPRTFTLAMLYGAGIVVSFTGLGAIFTAALGADGPRIFASNPWVNVGVGVLFLYFTFSLFGLYEIALPSFITGRLAGGGPKQGYGGAFLLGLLFSIVTFTCTIPIAATLLLVAASSEYRWIGFVAMFVYSVTMALPFLFIGLAPGLLKSVPKSGGWLHTVKVTMAFVELALALYYLSKADVVWGLGILSRTVMIAVWVALLAVTALYLLGTFRMRGDDEQPVPLGVSRMLCGVTFGVLAVFFASSFAGHSLGLLEVMLPPAPAGSQIAGGPEPGQQMFETLEPALAEAKQTGKPVFIEFTGAS